MNDSERFVHAAPKEGAEAEGEVRDLLASAGVRPALPAEEFAELEEVARGEWRALVDKQPATTNRWTFGLAMAATLVMALAVGWWWQQGVAPTGGAVVATVLRASGSVEGRGASGLAVGTTILAGEEVATAGGKLAVRLSGGHAVRLDENTKVQMIAGNRLQLDRGAIYFDSADGNGNGGIEIATIFGTVRDIGTQFEVRLDASANDPLRVRVREGAIVLEHEGDSHSASGGEELRLGADGGIVIAQTPAFGADWDWVAQVAPRFDIDGQPLSDYLAWVTRQTGWSLAFESSELEASAATVRLGGTIESLTADESLSVVLPGSGMDYRLKEGRLLILAGASGLE